jgi:hypothetical protein
MSRGAAERVVVKTTIGPPPGGGPLPVGRARFKGRTGVANDNRAPWPRQLAYLACRGLFLLALGFLLWRLGAWLL